MLSRTSLSLSILPTLALLVPGCFHGVDDPDADFGVADDDEVSDADSVDPPVVDPGNYLRGIDADFGDAADEFGVPAQLLQAIGHVETQWQMVVGEVEFEGRDPAFGVLALRGEALTRAAELAEVSVEAVKTDRRQHLRAGAALLSSYADELGIDRSDLGAWAPAVARFSGIPETSAALASYVHDDVYATLRTGVTIKDLAGAPVASFEPVDALPDFAVPLPDAQAASGPDYAASVWRPSSNYSSRPAGNIGKVAMVIIHTCEGSYASCWDWLVDASSNVSAHYVVKENGSEISQLVKESNKAWHISATYDCDRNSNVDCWRDGYGSNSFTVGIEHAGYASQSSWNSTLIENSAKLTCDITKAHGIPRDNKHIVAHGKLQPYNRVDPGPNWPWSTYLTKVNAYCGGGGGGGGVTGTVNTSGAPLTVRSGPSTGASAVGSVADGATVSISCQKHGTQVTGTYGTTTLWDYIGTGYISDAYVSTGSDGQVAPTCP